jgi:energy-converting hydrogenase Eha subunit A
MSTATVFIHDTDTVLDRAADYIDRYGWISTGLYDAHSGCTLRCPCHRTGTYPASIIGAIRVAIFGTPRWYLDTTTQDARHAYTAAVEWLNTYLLAIGHAGLHAPIFDWQTIPGRTCGDVCGALRAAATAHRHHTQRRAA